ncbi:MAG TPA: DUF763 domain-containing protein [Flavitalea sp.]|nr:DUF763 domain-containing protein [Flavitalea sp.]
MKRSGAADLPLHYGHVPPWLAQRMAKLGFAITESIITEYGKNAFLRRLSDPFWFQSFGAVMGMDWHSSGITTSVLGALKRSINPHSGSLGIYICGGKGKFSKDTPHELLKIADKTGLDGNKLVRSSKLTAKVDNTAIQDGFQLYMHNFILSDTGEWTVIQQGMKAEEKTARRYHWHSDQLTSFVEEPHTGICGTNQGIILNLTDTQAGSARKEILNLTNEQPAEIINEFTHLMMPSHHEVRETNVNLKRLGAVLWLAHEKKPSDFEDLLLLSGVGPRTIQSLALVSEVIHGTRSRFTDPARYSFAHGGKDGHPFPVPVKVYDEVIHTLNNAISRAKIGLSDKNEAIKKLHSIAANTENDFIPNKNFNALIEKERDDSWKYGGKTVFGDAIARRKIIGVQLKFF